jgi:hypothetical protein
VSPCKETFHCCSISPIELGRPIKFPGSSLKWAFSLCSDQPSACITAGSLYSTAVFNQAQVSPAYPDHSLQSLFHPILSLSLAHSDQTPRGKDKGIHLGCAESW